MLKETNILKIKGITKSYFKNVNVLKGIDCSIPKGTIASIVGPNGAGKTTLIRIIATLLNPSTGEFWINGLSSKMDIWKIRKYIGYSPERLPIDGRATGFEFLDFYAALYRKKRTNVLELLESLNLSNAANRPISTYSTGMMKRVGLARVFLIEPSIFLLDEPTAGLDPTGQRDIQNTILSIDKKNKIVLISSHNLYEVERISDQIFFLKDGILTSIDSVSEVFNEEEGPKIIDMIINNLDDDIIDSILKEFPGVKLISRGQRKLRLLSDVTLNRDTIITFVKKIGGDLVEIKYL